MKSSKAIAVLAVPFAVTSLVMLSAMCLTPYWKCWPQPSFDLAELWRPLVFILAVSSALAAVILWIDLLLIKALLPTMASSRTALVAAIGGVVAVAPSIIFGAVGGQGVGALSPQLEYIPLVVAGAMFALLLDKLTCPKIKGTPQR